MKFKNILRILSGPRSCETIIFNRSFLLLNFLHVFYNNTWFQFQPSVSYFSVYFQPKVFLILFLAFVFEFPEHSSVKI